MSTLKVILRDLLLALAIGVIIGLGTAIFFGLLGAMIKGGFWGGIEAARSAVLLIGGGTLLFSALLLLKGGNLPEEAFRFRLKKKPSEDAPSLTPLGLFRLVPRPYTTMAIAAGILLVSLIPDILLMNAG